MLYSAAPLQLDAPSEADVRIAREDAFRRLAGALAAIPVDASRTLADVLEPDADPVDALLSVARRARDVGKPVVYTDRTLEMHVALEPVDARDEVRTRLVRAKTPAVTIRSTLDALTDAALLNYSIAAGFALSHPTAAPNPRVKHQIALADMATEAAILDARRQLVDRIGQLRVTGHRKLEDLLLKTPGLEDELLKAIPMSVFGPSRQRARGMVHVSASMTPEHALELVTECMLRIPVESPPPRLALEAPPIDPITVRGVGVRPSHATLVRIGMADENFAGKSDAPAWADKALIAEGDARVAGGDNRTTGAVAAAMDDAEFAARRRLAQQIDELRFLDGRTVREEILSRKVTPADLMRYLGSADRFGMASATPDGRVSVRVRLPLAGLWRLLSDANQPAAAASDPSKANGNAP